MMSRSLSPSRFLIQRLPAALEAIRRHFCDFGCSPSFAEIAARIGVAKRRIRAIVAQLAELGLIGWTPGRRKSITLPRPLEMSSTSELVYELQRRGVVVSIAPAGATAAVSAWPEAAFINQSVPKVELEFAALLGDIK